MLLYRWLDDWFRIPHKIRVEILFLCICIPFHTCICLAVANQAVH